MRADTGVGPAMASGSQTYSGSWADLPQAPTNSSAQMAVAVVVDMAPGEAKISPWVRVPTGEKGEKSLLADPAIEHVATINGFNFVGGGADSAVSTMFVMLKPWDQRKTRDLSIEATIGRFFGATFPMKEAMSFAFNPPPIQGLGTTGGFEGYVQARTESTTAELNQPTQSLPA